ncbi:hypothetical protein EGYY_17110 [Eggerthella sp. YY7918]|nr:hypothetical protein EGYY_17110 [Eggerthella sp. YY7918]
MESPGLSEVRRQIPFLGLGLYWAWVTVVFYSDALVPASPDGNGLVETIWLWATWSHMIALFVLLRYRGSWAACCRVGHFGL